MQGFYPSVSTCENNQNIFTCICLSNAELVHLKSLRKLGQFTAMEATIQQVC